MPRPQKSRRICTLPDYCQFAPVGSPRKETIIMTVDEYETLRLMDFLGLQQEECAQRLGVARTTVQAIYNRARKKTAQALIEGKCLHIDGGTYKIYKEEKMKIAVTYEKEQVFQHFGHSEAFKLYTIENDTVKDTEVVSTQGSGHGALANFLKDLGVTTLICGGIGGGAKEALAQANIEIFPGASGNADEAVNSLLGGTLKYDPDTQCDHHGKEHHGHGQHGKGQGKSGQGKKQGHEGHHGCGKQTGKKCR